MFCTNIFNRKQKSLFLTLLLFIFLPGFSPLQAQTVIAFQGFESSPADNWPWIAPYQAPQTPQVFVGVSNYGFGFAYSGNYSARAGGGSTTCGTGSSNCVNGQSNGGSCTNNPNGSIVEFLPVDVGCYDQLNFKIHYRTHFLCSGEGQGFDGTDSLFFEVSLNGGPWFAADTLKGSNNHIWTFSTPIVGVGLTAPNPWIYQIPAGTQTFAFRTRAVVNRTDEVYYVDHAELSGVQATINPYWIAPDTLCSGAGPIPLDSLLSPLTTPGGQWSGAGVNAGIFNPSGLSGDVQIVYTAGMPPCDSSHTETIFVSSAGNPFWTPPPFLCTGYTVDLNDYLDSLATSGGIWSGTQVTGSYFNTTGLTDSVSISYTTGSPPCTQTVSAQIPIINSPDASFSPPDTLCSGAGLQNLNLWLLPTATPGGVWTGPQLSPGWFDPAAYSGIVTFTYTVSSGICDTSETRSVYISPSADASWTPPAVICAGQGVLDMNQFIDQGATTGGNWSGTGIIGNIFNPAGLNGYYPISYTAGTGQCSDMVVSYMNVVAAAIPSWTSPGIICSDASSIALSGLLSPGSTPGGTWSGNGVSNGNFNPAGLSGNIAITYYVGTPGCDSSETHMIEVLAVPFAAINAPDTLCADQTSYALNSFLAAGSFPGGIWTGPGIQGDSINLGGLSGSVSLVYYYGAPPCLRTLTHTLVLMAMPAASISGDTAVCAGTAVILTASGGSAYLWNNGSTNSILSVSPAFPATYFVTVSNGPCQTQTSFFLQVRPLPEINRDQALITAESCSDRNGEISGIEITGEAPVLLEWAGEEGFYISGNIELQNLMAGVYQLTVTDKYCSNSAGFIVPRDETLCETIYIPNIFSPDQDGNNDVFRVRGRYIEEVQMNIYNRWGNRVFSGSGSDVKWDGTMNGSAVEAGIFTYHVIVKLTLGKILERSGNVTLIR